MINLTKRILAKYKKIKSDKDFGAIFSGSILVFFAKVFAAFLSLATSVVVARYYGADVVGILALINSFFAIATVFTLMGTNISVLRFIPEYIMRYSYSTSFNVFKKMIFLIVTFSFILTIILFPNSSLIAEKFFKNISLSQLFSFASLILVFKTLQLFGFQCLRAVQNINAFAIVQFLTPLLNLIFLIIFTVLFSFCKYIPVYIQFFVFFLMAFVSLSITVASFKKKITSKDIKYNISFRKILKVSFPMMLTNSMAILMGELTTLIAGYFLTESYVGYYSIALKIALLTGFVLSAINTVVAPKFAELFHKGLIDELFIVAQKSTKLIFWTVIPLILFFVFFGKWIIIQLYGQDFQISYPLLLILLFGFFINSISGSVGNFMNMCGYERIFRNVMFFSVLINIGLNILLIPQIGIYGAAITTSVTQILWNSLLTVIIYKKYHKIFMYIPLIKIDKKFKS